jgi:hypothetical protein
MQRQFFTSSNGYDGYIRQLAAEQPINARLAAVVRIRCRFVIKQPCRFLSLQRATAREVGDCTALEPTPHPTPSAGQRLSYATAAVPCIFIEDDIQL